MTALKVTLLTFELFNFIMKYEYKYDFFFNYNKQRSQFEILNHTDLSTVVRLSICPPFNCWLCFVLNFDPMLPFCIWFSKILKCKIELKRINQLWWQLPPAEMDLLNNENRTRLVHLLAEVNLPNKHSTNQGKRNIFTESVDTQWYSD